jgi:hypothetical protein
MSTTSAAETESYSAGKGATRAKGANTCNRSSRGPPWRHEEQGYGHQSAWYDVYMRCDAREGKAVFLYLAAVECHHVSSYSLHGFCMKWPEDTGFVLTHRGDSGPPDQQDPSGGFTLEMARSTDENCKRWSRVKGGCDSRSSTMERVV